MEVTKKAYNEYVKKVTPTNNMWLDVAKAFLVGGTICTVGQGLTNLFLNIYPKIVKHGGAGALVPITGFANSVAAPAIEFRAEGQVFGIGVKIFTIAGPVILYGTLASWVLGLVYWIGGMMGIVKI